MVNFRYLFTVAVKVAVFRAAMRSEIRISGRCSGIAAADIRALAHVLALLSFKFTIYLLS